MAVREDWTRITHSIHNFFQALRSPTRAAMDTSRISIAKFPNIQPTALWIRSTADARALEEIERRRNRVYLSSVKNQIR